MSGIGHNSIAADRLRSFIERIEKLEEERAAIAQDIKEVKLEAKSSGFDIKTINQILKIRKMEAADREEQEALLDTYKEALGMLSDTPLGASAIDRVAQSRRQPTRKTRPPAEPDDDSDAETDDQAESTAAALPGAPG